MRTLQSQSEHDDEERATEALSFCNTHHDVVLRPGDGGQHVDAVCGEVSSLFGFIVDAVSPARVHHVLSIVLNQNDQITLGETQEGGVHPRCRIQVTETSQLAAHLKQNPLSNRDRSSPGFGQSSSPTTYLDLFLRPSRKLTTRSRMSSALLEVNVYSSPLMVARVKL